MTSDQIRSDVRGFIQQNFIFDANRNVADNVSLLGSGVVDSTGILELISYLEEHYQLKFADSELVADNFDSVERIVSFICSKVRPAGS